jgi:hypothetical protein
MARRKTDPQITGMAGEFLAAGKLFKRKYQVSVTLGNAKAIDLFVLNPETDRTFKVQVKTQRGKNNFPIRKEHIRSDYVYIFVRLNSFEAEEEFFIVSGRELLNDIGGFYGSSYVDPAKPSSMPAINYGPLTPYKDKWSIFDEQLQGDTEQAN